MTEERTKPGVIPDVHLKDTSQVEEELNTNVDEGLSSSEVDTRLRTYGKNVFDTQEAVTWPQILAYHLFNFLNLVLLVALALAFVVLSWIDAGVIAFTIIFNASIGFVQEYKSEKSMAALRNISAPSCVVLRDGQQKSIDASELVPGDILVVTQGDKIPADARVFHLSDLMTDESILTGETELVKKTIAPLVADGDNEISLGDRKNLLFMNSSVNKGKGRAIVYATGNDTEMGKIASTLLHAKKTKTPLQQRMDKLGILLSICAIFCIAVVLLTGWAWNTFSIYPDGLRVAAAAAVAIIPQSVVVVTSLTLAVGVKIMGNKNALIRKLSAVETLGNITNICSDKTGTLTQGKMSVTAIRLPAGRMFTAHGDGLNPEGHIEDIEENEVDVTTEPLLHRLITIGTLCNAASISLGEDQKNESDSKNEDHEPKRKEWVGLGSPTEVALIVLGAKVGLTQESLADKFTFEKEYPFDSSIKRMSRVYHDQERHQTVLFIKGAPEQLLELCNSYLLDDASTVVPLTEQTKFEIKERNKEMSQKGLRVLGLAFRDMSNEDNIADMERPDAERNCTLVGYVGIRDPPRDGVKEAIEACHDAGIAVHMVTGDHPFTAKAIAQEIGIFVPGMPQSRIDSLTMVASDFNKLTDEELHALPSLPLVIARCSPESKVRMVTELQRRGKRVAMLGDGVNDSPAIKLADIGVAMGINGSDITKEAADMVLLDDNFSTVLAAVREGRRIFQNIRRFIIYLVCSNIGQSAVIVFGVAFSLDPPLSPMEVLWVNLITAAPPAFVLGIVPEKAWYMNKYKRKVDEKFYTTETIADILFYGFLVGGLGIAQFCISRFVFNETVLKSQGATFANITILLMLFSYVCREMRGHFWRGGFIYAWKLHLAALFGIATIFFTFYTPPFEVHVFNHRRASYKSWLVAIASGVVFLGITELYKAIKKPLRLRSHAKELKKQAANDEYMLFNTNPAELAHEEEDFPENEAEELEDYPEYTSRRGSERSMSSRGSEKGEEGEEEEDTPEETEWSERDKKRAEEIPLSPTIYHRRRSSTRAASPAPGSPSLSSPKLPAR